MRNGRLHFRSEYFCGLTSGARAHWVLVNVELLKFRQRAEVLKVLLVTNLVLVKVKFLERSQLAQSLDLSDLVVTQEQQFQLNQSVQLADWDFLDLVVAQIEDL